MLRKNEGEDLDDCYQAEKHLSSGLAIETDKSHFR